MNAKGKKFIALFLIFSLLALSGNLHAKERRGVDLVITKKDGQVVKGELIVVKENSLLLKERESGGDVSVDIEHISFIRIVKKSIAVWGFRVGGAVVGAAIGCAVGGSLFDGEGGLNYGTTIGVGLSVALLGTLMGAVIGAAMGTDKTIQIAGKSDSEIKEALEYLRKKARVTNFQ